MELLSLSPQAPFLRTFFQRVLAHYKLIEGKVPHWNKMTLKLLQKSLFVHLSFGLPINGFLTSVIVEWTYVASEYRHDGLKDYFFWLNVGIEKQQTC